MEVFYLIGSISIPEQEVDQESGRSCSVCEYISSNEGFYIFSRLASFHGIW